MRRILERPIIIKIIGLSYISYRMGVAVTIIPLNTRENRIAVLKQGVQLIESAQTTCAESVRIVSESILLMKAAQSTLDNLYGLYDPVSQDAD